MNKDLKILKITKAAERDYSLLKRIMQKATVIKLLKSFRNSLKS